MTYIYCTKKGLIKIYSQDKLQLHGNLFEFSVPNTVIENRDGCVAVYKNGEVIYQETEASQNKRRLRERITNATSLTELKTILRDII